MNDSVFPVEFDAAIYRAQNPDLATFSDAGLVEHFEQFAYSEGRVANAIRNRADFVALISPEGAQLEIGPFDKPQIEGQNVFYFDVLNREELQARARESGRDPHSCPTIHYVSPTGDLGVIDRKFDTVFSSHVIEHQPDMIEHIHQVEGVLEDDGRYFLLIPDKRFCFDHFIEESTIAEVVGAHIERRKLHSGASFIEHRCFLTHNDPVRHWAGDHGFANTGYVPDKLSQAFHEWNVLAGQYIDVHAWQFSPLSFKSIVTHLRAAGLIRLQVERLYYTQRDSIEFMAILRK